jgi:hypothetical protein
LKRIEREIDSNGRPAASAASRSRSSPIFASSGVFAVACQPSASVAVRLNAPGLSPPTTIGGCGFWIGFGANPTSGMV